MTPELNKQAQGLRNMAATQKHIFVKLFKKEEVTPDQLQEVVQFYLETINFLTNLPVNKE